MDTNDQNEEKNKPLMKRVMTKLVKWIIGAGVLLLIPIVFPIAIIIAALYYIPLSIGTWLYDAVERIMK